MVGTALVSQHLEALALASELRCGFSGTNRGDILEGDLSLRATLGVLGFTLTRSPLLGFQNCP